MESSVPSITIKDLSPQLHRRLKAVAEMHHRSLQNEIISCLTRHAARSARSKTELMAEAASLRARLPRVDHGLVGAYKSEGRL